MNHLTARRVLRADFRASSWPVLVETEDGPRFTKLRGTGQGIPALVAEIIVAELAEAIGLNVPARSLVEIPPAIESENKRDELRDLLDASVGTNLGFAFLDGATMFDPLKDLDRVSPDEASMIVWLDNFVLNPDRTARNPNLMWWRGKLWLIDHGAALHFQYAWSDVTEESPTRPFRTREPHVLETRTRDMVAWGEMLAARITREALISAVDQVPDEFLDGDVARRRAAFAAYLLKRVRRIPTDAVAR